MSIQSPITQAQTMYDHVPDYIKEDIIQALEWADYFLADLEGSGHEFFITAEPRGQGVCCSFAKPSWGADHTSRPMEHGAQAVVMAVCEYTSGM